MAFELGQTSRALGLTAELLCDEPGYRGHDQHGRERPRIGHVRNREAAHWRYEEKVKNEPASSHRHYGGPDAEGRRYHEHPERKDQDESGRVKKWGAGHRKLSEERDDRH